MAENRIYEVVFIVDPATAEEDVAHLSENLQQIVRDQGGNITKVENMGRRQLAYEVGRNREGVYLFFEVEGTGREIAELERRMRVSDQVLRYLTVRVDEERRRAEKLKARRARKASHRSAGKSNAGARQSAPTAAAATAEEANEA